MKMKKNEFLERRRDPFPYRAFFFPEKTEKKISLAHAATATHTCRRTTMHRRQGSADKYRLIES